MPVICNDHLPLNGDNVGGRGGTWTQRVGSVEQNDQERGGSEGVQNLLFRAFLIHELVRKNL